MDPRKLFVDERLNGRCVYCGGEPETSDHVPSKVLLDEPFPSNLQVVDACNNCNNSFSDDEAYIACLIECVKSGTTTPENIERQKISRILSEQPSLESRISNSKIVDDEGNLFWNVETDRMKKVVLKLARGHLAYNLNWFRFDEPDFVECVPLALMNAEELELFEEESKELPQILPELGSRAFLTTFATLSKGIISNWQNWQVVQEGRYRYRINQDNGDRVQFVLNEYLACTVIWK